MARYYGSSDERGYGTAHQRLRRQLLARWRPGDPCARCGRPMWDKSRIDLGHTDDRTGYTGLEHSFCNRRAGSVNANRAGRAGYRPGGRDYGKPCAVCGNRSRHRAQNCAICGGHFHPHNGNVQYTCGRACGAEFKRRNRLRTGWQPAVVCACGRPKGKNAARCPQCRQAAAAEAQIQRMLARPGPHSKITYYTCRYCGSLKAARATAQRREVCPDRACQLARLQANNLRARNGATREDADAFMAGIVQGIARGIRLPPHDGQAA